MKKREEMVLESTWKLEDMVPSDQVWEELYKETEKSLSIYQSYKGKLGESAQTLYQCLKFDDECSQTVERLFVYARQKSDEDTANSFYQGLSERARSLSYQAGSLSSFIVPEILSIDPELLNGYMKSDCGIGHFELVLDRIRKKREHTLTAQMEELLAQSYEATQGTGQIYTMFNNADLTFPEILGEDQKPVRITHGNYIPLMESQDRRVRKDAFYALYSSYRGFRNTLAATFSANIKQAVFYSRAKKYSSSRAYYLSENEIPESVYDNLIAAVREGLPMLHQYIAVRKKMLEVGQLHMYDLYLPIVPSVNRSISFEKAKEMVLAGLAPLGLEYRKVLQEAFDNRWIDVYENQGKRSGAYSWGAYGIHPYVLLNYNGTLNHVFTLAHEMGHALHSYYSDQSQPYTYAGYTIFVAEVASTCNEALLIRHLLKETTDRKEKAYLLNHFLDSFRTTMYRQAMFAEFETKTHREVEEGGALTAENLCRMYHQLNVDYFGSDMVIDEEIDYEWSRIPHFYTPFYVYQYATGFSAAVAISSKILAGDQKTLEGYLTFLKGGCSMSPIDLLKICGIDMSGSEPVREALSVFQELLNEFESLSS